MYTRSSTYNDTVNFFLVTKEKNVSTSEIYKDYHTFGMLMPGRSYQPEDYRFGFNGQEKDDDINGSGNLNTAMYWEYDTRLGRRLNLDPIISPSQSQYSCFDNNPIYFVDKKGKTGEAYIQGNNVIIESNYFLYGTAVSKVQAQTIAADINSAWNSANGKVTIDGKQYNVKFKVTATAIANKGVGDFDYTLGVANLASKNDPTGMNYKDNYVRIENSNKGQNESFGYEISQTPGETGYWLSDEVYSNEKTKEHEYGEGLGLDHPANSYSNGVLRIMAGKSPDINPSQRSVTPADISDLDLGTKLSGKKPGERIGLGEKKYEYYEKDQGIIYNTTKIG